MAAQSGNDDKKGGFDPARLADLTPTQDEAWRSLRLCGRILGRARSGFLSFEQYMRMCLYEPQLGYYSSPGAKFGAPGDFVTAPELTPLFGRCLYRAAREALRQSGGLAIEFGGGSGALASGFIAEAKAWGDDKPGGALKAYRFVELSADLAARQVERIRRDHPDFADRVGRLEGIPDSFDGVALGNELLDAIPYEKIRKGDDGRWRRAGVEPALGAPEGRLDSQQDADALAQAVGSGNLLRPVWRGFDESDPLAADLRAKSETLGALPPGYVTESNPAARAFARSIAQSLNKGAFLFIDYGCSEREYYHPLRQDGTWMGHFRHHAIQDPFFWPGLQDMTAHVDFTAIATEATDAGMELSGYARQSDFLVGCGILGMLEQIGDPRSKAYIQAAQAAQQLLMPEEMGEQFKAMACAKGVDCDWACFAQGDLTGTL